MNRIRATKTCLAALLALLLVPCLAGARSAPESFADLVDQLSPTVVNIYTTQTVKAPQWQNELLQHEFFRRFFGVPEMPDAHPREMKRTSLGSGVIMSADGFIITNNHVVEDADEINVEISTGEEFRARVIGRDPKTDLALIKIDPSHALPSVTFADSEKLRVGDWVIAIGNPFGFEHTVTAGIVSAKGRHLGASSYENFIQTDASINPGNSGGPLFDIDGKVVGINSAIYSRSGGNVGLGFAIPSNLAINVIEQLKATGSVSRGWLGVMIQQVTADLARQFGLERPMGALIGEVSANSPAAKAGIKPGDVIVEYDGKPIKMMNMLPTMVSQTPIGSEVDVAVIRNGETKHLKVTIEKLEEEDVAAPQSQRVEEELGITVQELTPDLAKSLEIEDTRGLLITEVNQDSIAGRAGLRRGDLILEAGRQPIGTVEEFSAVLQDHKDKDQILLLVKRENHTRYLVLRKK
ncbi:MAG: DegQ family serine endoprotease [Thermodesulfobacteriota bacterium]